MNLCIVPMSEVRLAAAPKYFSYSHDLIVTLICSEKLQCGAGEVRPTQREEEQKSRQAAENFVETVMDNG